jgi:RNA polymerase-binding transcription factor DksA
MDGGTYGTCLNCGHPIAYDRLHAAPELQLCGPCSAKR